MLIASYESFLLGVKPACSENILWLPTAFQLKLRRYPSVKKENRRGAIYFQTEEMKQRFLEETKNLSPDSPEYIRILGLTLGFPPKAVDFHVRSLSRDPAHPQEATKWYNLHKVRANYAGNMFAENIDDLVENTEWLWNRYGREWDMSLSVIRETDQRLFLYLVPFGDREKLKEAEEGLRKVLDENRKFWEG
ncbi:tetratricopeptide repeat protein [Staphylospora marina]|uniref:tetratricopeptide repeat protein n=1 Tax=Staphylospora marina TaxID=2490858 RepID=UPI000F5BC97D|nr:hypothetical protein [Staphylospora marina]